MKRRRSTADDTGRVWPTSREQLVREDAEPRAQGDGRAAREYVAGGDGTKPVRVPEAADNTPER